MAGHSKWANIKNHKSAVDAKKSKVFGMLSKLITIAVREGNSGDPTQNPRLRLALDKARAANMPNQNVQKALDKGLGKGDGGMIEEIYYEGFGPGGVGLMIRVLTDNRNRTASEVKLIMDRNGGRLGGPGSVGYMFERQGDAFHTIMPIEVEESIRPLVQELVEKLEDHDDIEAVFTNLK